MMSKVAIFCEGETDIQFLKSLIEHMGFRKNDVIPYIMSSKSYFFDENHRKYKDVKLETDSDTIRKILFVNR
jgi:hypothetical protein